MDEGTRRTIDEHARWLDREPGGARAELAGAKLAGLRLGGARLDEADLRDADLRRVDLSGASLVRAQLRFACLRGADLRGAKLRGADLQGADLSGADLSGADLRHARLTRAILDDVRMAWFDPTLLAERLYRAAGEDLDRQMLASYVGRHVDWCWENLRHLSGRHRRWILGTYAAWLRPGDEAPTLLRRIAQVRS